MVSKTIWENQIITSCKILVSLEYTRKVSHGKHASMDNLLGVFIIPVIGLKWEQSGTLDVILNNKGAIY